ncbi:MAG TPA: DUF6235 family protein [Streptosporangiaceae bacterium]
MSAPLVPASGRPSSFKLTGLDLLDKWVAHATQPQKNIVHEIIFAVADKTVFANYTVVDAENHMQFFVLTKSDLVLKFRIDGFDSFGILYIGPIHAAPGLDGTLPASISSAPDSSSRAGSADESHRLM